MKVSRFWQAAMIVMSLALLSAPLVEAQGRGRQELSDATLEAMNQAIQDEYHAEFVYLKVIEKNGDVVPFSNIVHAERRHSSVVARLFASRDLPVPESNWNLDNVPGFDSVADACSAGVVAERENIALYDELLMQALPRDVHNVFTNIRAASLNNHMPAFEACGPLAQGPGTVATGPGYGRGTQAGTTGAGYGRGQRAVATDAGYGRGQRAVATGVGYGRGAGAVGTGAGYGRGAQFGTAGAGIGRGPRAVGAGGGCRRGPRGGGFGPGAINR